MKHIACASCHRHSNLINSVYPTSPGEEGPKSAALSLLVFYATSKPQKLPKIGAFLEAKVEKDIGNSRFSHVAVTLTIITTLLRDCKQNVSLFSKCVLRIILRVLSSEQTLIKSAAIETFMLFTNSRNPEDALDVEFSLVHNEVVLKLCQEATKVYSGGAEEQIKWRYSALNALQSLCEFNYFVDGSKIDISTEKVMESILKNIEYADRKDTTITYTTNEIPSMNPTKITKNGVVAGSAADEKLTRLDLSKVAVKCLTEIIRNSNALTLRTLLYSTFRILDSNNQLEEGTPALFLFPIFFASSETQYHFVIITMILDRIANENRVPVKTTLVKIIRYLVLAEKLAGLTIPELLETFSHHLNESSKLIIPAGSKESMELDAMQVAFTKAIGSLSVHLAYPNQLNEIICFLVNRAQFDRNITKLTTSQEKYLAYILMGLAEVLSPNDSKPKNISKTRNSFVLESVSYNLLIPLMINFESNSIDVRLELARVFNSAVKSARGYSRQGNFDDFFKSLLSAICLYGSNQTNRPIDYVSIGLLMCSMVYVHSPDALGPLIPVLFYIQNRCSAFQEAQQRGFGTVMVDFLIWAAAHVGAINFGKFMLGIKQKRIELNEWCPNLDLNEGSLETLRPLSFNDVEANTNPKGFTLLLNEAEVKESLFNSMMEVKAEKAAKFKNEWERSIIKDDPIFRQSLSNPHIPNETNDPTSKHPSNSSKPFNSRKVVAIKVEAAAEKPESKPAAANMISINDSIGAGSENPDRLKKVPGDLILSNETIPAVLNILKAITDSYGTPSTDRKSSVSREHSADVSGKIDHELDFLRSRTKSNTVQSPLSGAFSPEKTSSLPNSTFRNKIREPAIFGMQE